MITDLLLLDRPLICIDLETTGIHPKVDRIVQIAVIRIEPTGEMTEGSTLVNPRIPIPAESSAVHGITDEMVRDKKGFDEMAQRISQWMTGCDVCGYNVGFDLSFLEAEFERCRVKHTPPERVIDAFKIFQKRESRNLSAAVKFFLDEEMVDAHDAMADIKATLRVFRAQLLRYEDLPRSIGELHASLNAPKPGHLDRKGRIAWRNGVAIMNFGKYGGRPLKEIPSHYLEWMVSPAFQAEPDMKHILREALNGRYPQPPVEPAGEGEPE